MKTRRKGLSPRQLMAIGFSVLVLAVIVAAVTLLDSPAQERLNRLDERRMSDLREISTAINVYWTEQGILPSTFDDLADDRGYDAELVDPETGAAYGYRVVDEDSYELCATFVTAEAAVDRDPYFKGLWHHGIGRQCFTLTAQDLEQFREAR